MLVANLWGSYLFGANNETAVQNLQENQGPIVRIGLMVGIRWRLEIELDGSAMMAFDQRLSTQKAKVFRKVSILRT